MKSYGMQRFENARSTSGRERLDGYDRSMFETMTADERHTVTALLKEDALRGDGTAIQALPWADPANAEMHLREVFAHSFDRLAGPPKAYLVRDLLRITGDARFLDELFELCRSKSSVTRNAALMLVLDTAIGEQLMPRFAAAMQSLVDNPLLDATDKAQIIERLRGDGKWPEAREENGSGIK